VAFEANGATRQSVEIRGVELRAAVRTEHVPVETVEQDHDGVAG
jgi:hypothetical protein